MKSKRGAYFFLLDVFLVILILFVTILTVLGFRSSEPSLLGIDQQLDTITFELYNVEIRDYESPNVTALRLPGGAIYEEGWNAQLTVDELIVLLMENNYTDEAYDLVDEAVINVPQKYGINYTINTSLGLETVYSRESLVSLENSIVKLTRKKVTWPRSNLTHAFSPVVTEVSLWQ